MRCLEKEVSENLNNVISLFRELQTEISESGEDESLRPRLEQAKKLTTESSRKVEMEKQNVSSKKLVCYIIILCISCMEDRLMFGLYLLSYTVLLFYVVLQAGAARDHEGGE